jgi:hypothetical protein
LSLSGDAAARAARTLAERLPAVEPRPAKAPAKPPTDRAPATEALPPATPKLTPAQAAKRQEGEQRAAAKARRTAIDALERRMTAVAPAVFGDMPMPLKIGIDHDIAALLGAEARRKTLGRFLARWTRRADYLRAIASGGPRFGLDGHPAGLVTADQAETATASLAALAAKVAP